MPKYGQIVWPWMSNYFTASRFAIRANLTNLAEKRPNGNPVQTSAAVLPDANQRNSGDFTLKFR